MDSTLKFYLLAEESGWDCSPYAFNYFPKLFTSSAYEILSVNVLSARNELGKRAKEICTQYDTILREPKTLHDVFVTEVKINYLALHSFPEYYLNPFTISPTYHGDVSSIGELIFTLKGEEMSLNEIIENQEIPLDTKKEEVNKQLDIYLDEINDLVNSSIKSIDRSSKKETKKSSDIYTSIFSILGFALLNLLVASFFLYPSEPFRQALYELNPNYSLSYLAFLCPMITFIYDIVFITFQAYKSKIAEPYNYAKRFLKKNSKRVFDQILKTKDELYNYICGAINNRLILQDDIKDFSCLSNAYVNFDKILTVNKLKRSNTYRILLSLTTGFGTIAGITTIITLVIYIISAIIHLPL